MTTPLQQSIAWMRENRELTSHELRVIEAAESAAELAEALRMYMLKTEFFQNKVLSRPVPSDNDLRRWREVINNYQRLTEAK